MQAEDCASEAIVDSLLQEHSAIATATEQNDKEEAEQCNNVSNEAIKTLKKVRILCIRISAISTNTKMTSAVKHPQTSNFSPFIFVYHYNEFTLYFTDEVCNNYTHERATSGRPPSF